MHQTTLDYFELYPWLADRYCGESWLSARRNSCGIQEACMLQHDGVSVWRKFPPGCRHDSQGGRVPAVHALEKGRSRVLASAGEAKGLELVTGSEAGEAVEPDKRRILRTRRLVSSCECMEGLKSPKTICTKRVASCLGWRPRSDTGLGLSAFIPRTDRPWSACNWQRSIETDAMTLRWDHSRPRNASRPGG